VLVGRRVCRRAPAPSAPSRRAAEPRPPRTHLHLLQLLQRPLALAHHRVPRCVGAPADERQRLRPGNRKLAEKHALHPPMHLKGKRAQRRASCWRHLGR
jgi:hypothetical protein